jgi:ferredoxin-type protein NapG
MPDDKDDKPVDRRSFFREGIKEFLRPLGKAVNPIEKMVKQLGDLVDPDAETGAAPAGQSPASPAPVDPMPGSPRPSGTVSRPTTPLEFWLRPPGALDEPFFPQTCSRSALCVGVCPVQCILIDPTGGRAGGAPYIDASVKSCVVCKDLACMHACPSGALVPTPLARIDMGTAVWDEPACLRSRQQECRICVDVCPLGTVAIDLRDGKVWVNPPGCIGCGMCQQDCPTSPKSITVMPRAQRMSLG